jgi:hypothetical protein
MSELRASLQSARDALSAKEEQLEAAARTNAAEAETAAGVAAELGVKIAELQASLAAAEGKASSAAAEVEAARSSAESSSGELGTKVVELTAALAAAEAAVQSASRYGWHFSPRYLAVITHSIDDSQYASMVHVTHLTPRSGVTILPRGRRLASRRRFSHPATRSPRSLPRLPRSRLPWRRRRRRRRRRAWSSRRPCTPPRLRRRV